MESSVRDRIPFNAVAAERQLRFIFHDGTGTDVRIQLAVAEPDPEYPGNYGCVCNIEGFSKPEKIVLAGIDAMQALLLTLQIIPTFLGVLAKQYNGTFSWLDTPDLGFPEFSFPRVPNAG